MELSGTFVMSDDDIVQPAGFHAGTSLHTQCSVRSRITFPASGPTRRDAIAGFYWAIVILTMRRPSCHQPGYRLAVMLKFRIWPGIR